jgi:MerR family transcriptional regulator, redox-sensitive transcriptional activator SoxR
MHMNDGLAIGEVAARAGCATSAVRYYERVGLLPPARRVGGKRVYDRTVFEYLAVIQLAQDAGFTIADTKALMHGFARATPASRRWRVLAAKKLEEIEQRIARAQQMQAVLHRLLECRCETLSQCVESRAAAMALAERNAAAVQTVASIPTE